MLREVTDGVATITLNLPERRNPISDPVTIDALLGALAATSADRSIKVAILTGAGTASVRVATCAMSVHPAESAAVRRLTRPLSM